MSNRQAISKTLERLLAATSAKPAGKNQWSAPCPAHDDSSPSLSIGLKNDSIGLTCHAGCSVDAICKAVGIQVADLGGRQRAAKPAAKPKPLTVTIPQLSDAELAEARTAAGKLGPHKLTGYRLKSLFPYRTAKGAVWCYRARYDNASGEKQILPFHWNGADWVKGEPRVPRGGKPLYCLPETLATDGPVFVVEGEKCVNALRALELAATTSGGAKSAGKADWSPLAGRSCIIWPDNDEPGDGYAADVGEALAALGCAVTCIDLAALDLPGDGYDAADWLQDNPKAKARDVLALPTVALRGSEPEVTLIRAADVQAKPVDWLWDGWLARSMLHILAGDGGTGKTTLSLSLAAAVSQGGRLPDGTKAAQGNVLFWTGEDALAEVLIPRLQEAGADMTRVFFVRDVGEGRERRAFDPATDVYALEQQARRIGGVALVVVDPIASAVAGDSHKNTEVRRGLQPLVDLGEALGAAVLGITHFSKNSSSRRATERIIGSVAFSALARVSMVTVMGKDGACRFVRSKSNVGPQGDGFEYRIEVADRELDGKATKVSSVAWGGPLYGRADELLEQVEAKRLQRDEACDWLYQLLKGGPITSKELKAKAADDGVAWRTVERAKEQLDVIAERQGVKGKGRGVGDWIWRLPASSREAAGVAKASPQPKRPATKYSG
ncbi:AAA family ATPase [Pseudoxanthomonas japonensis]|uniref:AAA family ATPase n=1 Tax=Pseudoxanthomonas japonensis TaxID=69284 RepID=UPI003748DF9C